jgi:hypothetical protein
MNAQDSKKRSDWLMRLAQVASITVAVIIASEFVGRHWQTIASMLGLGS